VRKHLALHQIIFSELLLSLRVITENFVAPDRLTDYREAYRRMQNAGQVGSRSDAFFSLNGQRSVFQCPVNSTIPVSFVDQEADIDLFYEKLKTASTT
jgi:hypothetical protein